MDIEWARIPSRPSSVPATELSVRFRKGVTKKAGAHHTTKRLLQFRLGADVAATMGWEKGDSLAIGLTGEGEVVLTRSDTTSARKLGGGGAETRYVDFPGEVLRKGMLQDVELYVPVARWRKDGKLLFIRLPDAEAIRLHEEAYLRDEV